MKLKLQKKDPRFDIPTGVYTAKFLFAEPVDESEFSAIKNSKTAGPRLRFSFEIIEGAQQRKVIAQLTGSAATPKSRLRALLVQMAGGELAEGQEITVEDFQDRIYKVSWQPNPVSPNHNNHIASLYPVTATQSPATTNGTPTPIAPKKPPARHKAPVGPRFWIPDEKTGEDKLVPEDEVQDLCNKLGDCAKLSICAANENGDALGEYRPASELGFVLTANTEGIPF